MIINFIGSVLFFSVYSFWLGFSLFLAVAGALLPIKSQSLKSDAVKDSNTICRALFEKQKLSPKEYAFETDQVAENYDDLVFKGYGFIMAPVIWTLKKSDIIDQPLLFLAHRWMRVHHFVLKTENKNENHKTPSLFDLQFTKLCVSIAKGTGKSLSLLP